MNTSHKRKTLEHNLRNNPHGIHAVDLPDDPELIEWMKSLLDNKKAVWLQKGDDYYFIMIREPYKAPMGKRKWVWET